MRIANGARDRSAQSNTGGSLVVGNGAIDEDGSVMLASQPRKASEAGTPTISSVAALDFSEPAVWSIFLRVAFAKKGELLREMNSGDYSSTVLIALTTFSGVGYMSGSSAGE